MKPPLPVTEKLAQALRLRRALSLVFRNAPGWTLVNVVLVFLQGILPLAALYVTKLVVDAVAAGLSGPDKEAAFRHAALMVALAGGVALLTSLLRTVGGMVSEAQSQIVSDRMYGILHAKSVEVDLEYYENSQYYNTLHRAQQEAPFRPTRVVNDLIQLGQSAVSLAAIAGLLCMVHWGVTAVLFVASLPALLVRTIGSTVMFRWQRNRTLAERQTWYYNWLITGQPYAKEVRVFDLGRLFMERFRDLRRQLRQERLRISLWRSAADFGAQATATLALYGAFAFVAYRTVQGAITVGDLVMYYQAFQRVQGALNSLLGSLAGLYEDNLFLSNLYEFLDLKPKVTDPPRPKRVPRPMKEGIVFDHVNFHYPNTQRKVLEDITLMIRPGEKIAVVGENGSGKTTLIKLLCRLYDPIVGRITLDGIDLREFAVTDLRRQISVIFQDYARYFSTARENIWLGNHCLAPTDDAIILSAQRSGAHPVITRLPQGYETVLGRWFDEGEELSFGEWQKIALARAFLREAQIIVLDEPTSAMDARAEYEVFKQFRTLAEGRAAVLISHRFSTVRMADRIYVLAEGRIAESGSHEELMRRQGMYAHLFETQAQFYR